MSGPLGASQFMYSSGADNFYEYQIQKSIRIDRADQSYLQSPTHSSDNSKKFSASFWVKRSELGLSSAGVVAGSSGGGSQLQFETDDTFRFSSHTSMDSDPRKFRDSTGWYHFFVKNGPNSGDGAIYVNGNQLTLSTNTFNSSSGFFQNGASIQIGTSNNGTYTFDGFIAEVNVFYDQTKAHTDFGETKNGVWIPKEYSGSFGSSLDFQLKFLQDGTGTNSSGLGADTSGNDNHFSVHNMGSDHQTLQSPTFGS